MNVFWILVIVLTIAAVAGLLIALVRPRPAAVERAHNRSLHEIRLAELRRDVEDHVITDDALSAAKNEIDRAMLEEADAAVHPVAVSSAANRWITAAIIMCVVPAIAGLSYLKLGQPLLASGAAPDLPTEAASEQRRIDEMIATLEQRLVGDPNSAEGWLLLGRSYMALSRYDEAVPALARAHELVGDVPQLLLQYADAMAMANGGHIGDDGLALVKRALEIEPENIAALWLAGVGAAEAGERSQALEHLRRARTLSARKGTSTVKLDALIGELETEPDADVRHAQATVSIQIKIDIEPNLSAHVGPEDVLFVFARAPGQGGPPLAVSRTAVDTFPREIILDDTMAMAPMFKLRHGETVVITARISRSGAAGAQRGDLQGSSNSFAVGDTVGVNIFIDEVVE